jgi:CheY-like chemotaxis protein
VTAAPRDRPLILHVEDNAAQRDVLKVILEGNGFAVLQAETAEEALRMCRETPVSLILADHMLAGMTGADLAANIKASKPTLPVVMHSGSPPASMAHLDGFIQKGESVRSLVAFLTEFINRFRE